MAETFKPDTAEQVAEAVQWAASTHSALEIVGHGTKRALGRPVKAGHVLDMSAFSGVTLYEPEELIMRTGANTPLSEVEATLAQQGQMLAFEPQDLGALLGLQPGQGTIGGVFMSGLAGPRRILAGAARDHLLGFKAVSGRAEQFKSGGRVVKNVTGFDLSKLLAGSFGTLAAATELTFKVLPRPEKVRTVLLFGADADAAGQAMRNAMGSAFEVTAAAYLPESLAALSEVEYVRSANASVTAIRVEGPDPSVAARSEALQALLAGFGPLEVLHTVNSIRLWHELRDVLPLAHELERQVWRISVAPTAGPSVLKKLTAELGGEGYLDLSGGLVWLAVPAAKDASAQAVRAALKGGHATLIRAAETVRGAVDVFQPQPAGVRELTDRVREAFDPAGVLNPGRM